MNVENIRKVRDVIADLPAARFNMAAWAIDEQTADDIKPTELLHSCGTCGCIGGWTNAVLGGIGSDTAETRLGLTNGQGWQLFYSHIDADITPAQAVAVLDHLIDTGEVDWSVADSVPA